MSTLICHGRKTASTRNKAFTLVELFVVIVILAIVSAILLPVYAQGRQAKGLSTEVSHEKQVALAMLMYVQDYDNRYPLASSLAAPTDQRATTDAHLQEAPPHQEEIHRYLQNWGPGYPLDANRVVPGLVEPYLKNNRLFLASDVPSQSRGHVLEFMYNDLLAQQSGRDVARPSVTVMLVSAENRWKNVGHAYTPDAAPVAAVFDLKGHLVPGRGATISDARTRQKGGAVFAFADGHVKWFPGSSNDPIFFPPQASTSRSAVDPVTKKQVGPEPDAHLTFQGQKYQGTFHIR